MGNGNESSQIIILFFIRQINRNGNEDVRYCVVHIHLRFPLLFLSLSEFQMISTVCFEPWPDIRLDLAAYCLHFSYYFFFFFFFASKHGENFSVRKTFHFIISFMCVEMALHLCFWYAITVSLSSRCGSFAVRISRKNGIIVI